MIKTYSHIIPGFVRVWDTENDKSESFIISEKDCRKLTLSQLKELRQAREEGKEKLLNPQIEYVEKKG